MSCILQLGAEHVLLFSCLPFPIALPECGETNLHNMHTHTHAHTHMHTQLIHNMHTYTCTHSPHTTCTHTHTHPIYNMHTHAHTPHIQHAHTRTHSPYTHMHTQSTHAHPVPGACFPLHRCRRSPSSFNPGGHGWLWSSSPSLDEILDLPTFRKENSFSLLGGRNVPHRH